MRRVGILLAMLMFWGAGSAHADCRYFRVRYKFLHCEESKEKEVTPADPDPIEGAELNGLAVRVLCSCDYSLSGSDPRCDFDQTVEQSQIFGTDNVSRFCARGPSLCNDVCRRTLP